MKTTKKARATAHRCDDENGTSWDVCQGIEKGIRTCIAQGFKTRAEARAYAAKINAEPEAKP